MIEHRSYRDLGGAQHGWLDTRHHFSFADYYDPERMNWGNLRVWNDDSIAPHSGFPLHPHRDMEIITYVREGAITHEDTLGNQGRTVAGDVQVMSAGTGIAHSELNKEDETTRIFQIWIMPNATGLPPTWAKGALAGKVASVFSSTGTGGGQEMTITSTWTTLAHHGMVIVPIGYTTPAMFDISQVGGGTPYGASTIAGGDGSRQPDERELGIARHQGEHVAKIARKLKN